MNIEENFQNFQKKKKNEIVQLNEEKNQLNKQINVLQYNLHEKELEIDNLKEKNEKLEHEMYSQINFYKKKASSLSKDIEKLLLDKKKDNHDLQKEYDEINEALGLYKEAYEQEVKKEKKKKKNF